MRINYAIVYVSDMQRSIAFYRDVVGLRLKFDSPHWTEFATEGATLALHRSDAPAQAGDTHPERPGTCRTGFNVLDLDTFHQRMTEYKVRCLQPPTETFGVHIAQYADPDGMIFSVSGARRG